MRVEFMIIGAAKSGTTSLANQLSQHPQICFCSKKEPGFFSTTPDWKRHVDEYHRLFDPKPGQICGEGSTNYTFLPSRPETHLRIYEYNPDVKLIYIMRNPVDRAISNFNFDYGRGAKHGKSDIFRSNIVNISRYGVQLRRYLDVFPLDRIHLIIFEEYIENEAKVLADIASFLGISEEGFKDIDLRPRNVSKDHTFPSRRINSIIRFPLSRYAYSIIPKNVRSRILRSISSPVRSVPSFTDSQKEALWRLLESDVEQVESLLGRPLDVWRKRFANVHPTSVSRDHRGILHANPEVEEI